MKKIKRNVWVKIKVPLEFKRYIDRKKGAYYVITSPLVKGLATQGKSMREAIYMGKDAARGLLEPYPPTPLVLRPPQTPYGISFYNPTCTTSSSAATLVVHSFQPIKAKRKAK